SCSSRNLLSFLIGITCSFPSLFCNINHDGQDCQIKFIPIKLSWRIFFCTMLHVKNALLPQPALSAIFQFSIALMLSTMPSITALSENQTNIEAWLAKAPLPPPFAAGPTKAAWEKQRLNIREQVWQLLGKLPPRPPVPKIEILSREDKGEYVLEKFQFDNAAGSIVPGYALLPKQATNKAPAILYCHWHGGEYEIGKEELFQSKHMPEA